MVNFREASEKDIPLIQDLARKSWEVAFKDILSKDQIEYMLDQMYSDKELDAHLNHNPNFHYYILQNGEIPVGYVGFEHHYKTELTKLHRIYLLPEEKGKGYGKTGIDFVKQKTEDSGDTRLLLTVNKENQAKAVYEKQGFIVIEEVVVDIGNGFVMDDYVMEYTL